MSDRIFIQTNHRQLVGALVGQYALRRNSRHNDRFEVEILNQADHGFFGAKEGQAYLRKGATATWRNDDLQSFTPLRFMPPQSMDYQGRAIVIDPDVFAVGDVYELLSRDMKGAALMCRRPPSSQSAKAVADCLPSSVMLLDCAKLRHWNCEAQFNELFSFQRDYTDWMCLKTEDRSTIGIFEDEWNDFDRLSPNTKLLHNTRRRTQPWKTGLPFEFEVPEKAQKKRSPLSRWLKRVRKGVLGGGKPGHYQPHDDPSQERLFFGLLRECMDKGLVSEGLLRDEMRKNHLRHDALRLLDETPPLAA